MATDKQDSLIFYKSEDGNIQLNVKLEKDTVWLTQSQMSNLFGVDRTVIVRHIRNIYKSAELCEDATCAKNAQVQEEGGRTVRRTIPYYNLDMIISVGYRVNSKNATQFRIWATSILKQYLIKGYAINDQRLQQLGEVIRIMKRTQNELDAKQVLSVIENYSTALTLLDDYDHQCMKRPEGSKATYVLSYEECRNLIDQMRFNADSDLFGHEKMTPSKVASVIYTKVLEEKTCTLPLKKKPQIYYTSSLRTTVSATGTNVSRQRFSIFP